MKTIEKRVIVTKTSEGVFFYTLQIRKWFDFPLLRTKWKTIQPEFQPTYEDAINLIEPKINSLEQTEAGRQFLKTSQTNDNQQSDEQLLLKNAVIKSVCEKHQWKFYTVERVRQCHVCGHMELY